MIPAYGGAEGWAEVVYPVDNQSELPDLQSTAA